VSELILQAKPDFHAALEQLSGATKQLNAAVAFLPRCRRVQFALTLAGQPGVAKLGGRMWMLSGLSNSAAYACLPKYNSFRTVYLNKIMALKKVVATAATPCGMHAQHTIRQHIKLKPRPAADLSSS